MTEIAGKNRAIRGRKKQKILNQDDDDERRAWSDLPSEIVGLFMRRLPYIDQINLRTTCKLWHSVGQVPTLSGSEHNHMPWLLGINCDADSSWSSSKISDPTYKKTYTIDMRPLKIKLGGCHNCFQVHESKSGWLLLSWRPANQLHHLVMYSPFLTRNNLHELPILTYEQIILATFPISNSDSSSYSCWSFIALSHVAGTSDLAISTCTWGDNAWITRHINCHFSLYDVKRWIYSQGLFYYATKFGEVGTLSVDRNEWNTLPGLYVLRWDVYMDLHMMRSDEEVLYLFIYGASENKWSYPTDLDAHRLDLKLLQGTRTWESRIESLGQSRALFLDTECKSSAKLISNAPKETENRIFHCSGREPSRHSTLRHACIDKQATRSFPCSDHYGSFSSLPMYRKLWIDPPTA